RGTARRTYRYDREERTRDRVCQHSGAAEGRRAPSQRGACRTRNRSVAREPNGCRKDHSRTVSTCFQARSTQTLRLATIAISNPIRGVRFLSRTRDLPAGLSHPESGADQAVVSAISKTTPPIACRARTASRVWRDFPRQGLRI